MTGSVLDFSANSVERYRTVALKVALTIGVDANSAQDIAQESLVRLYQSRDKVSSGNAVISWLTTTARRLAFRHLAESRRFVPIHDNLGEPGTESEIVARLEEERSREVLAPLIRRLPTSQRNLVDSVFVQGLSYRETARRLGVKLGSVGPTRGRALKKLCTALGESKALAS